MHDLAGSLRHDSTRSPRRSPTRSPAARKSAPAIAIDIDGEFVVDMWGGHADAAKTVPWGEDTIVNVFSSTKNITALAGLMLIDRGLVEADRAGRASTGRSSRQTASRTSSFAICCRTARGCRDGSRRSQSRTSTTGTSRPTALATQAPWWKPGTRLGYHALTYGHLIGEVMRRVTGKTLKEFVRDEIAGPTRRRFSDRRRHRRTTDRIAELIPAD